MEYRDQLKYIKSHGTHDKRTVKKRRRKQEKHKDADHKKEGMTFKLLWMIQAAASLCLIGAMLILGILPPKYMIGMAFIALLLLCLTKIQQQRSLRRTGRKNGGRRTALAVSIVCVILGFYAFKVNFALDHIAVGEESGNYEKAHMTAQFFLIVTEQCLYGVAEVTVIILSRF